MKLVGVHVEPVQLDLVAPLRSGAGELSKRSGYRIRLRDARGPVGCGEALPLPASGTEQLPTTASAIREFASACNGHEYELAGFLDLLGECLAEAPAARCAFDVAAHELEARLRGTSVAALLGAGAVDSVRVNALVHATEPEACVREARSALRRGYRTLKLKVGSEAPSADVERVRLLRQELGPEPRLRLDANGAWSGRRALAALERLAPFDVELVEQPVAPTDLTSLRGLHERSPIPVAVDETLATEKGRSAFLGGDVARIAVIKPMVQGGLRPSLQLATRAAARGLACFATTTLDGPLGTRAALQLAAALPDFGFDHGLAAADVIEDAFPESLIPRDGALRVPGPDEPGASAA